ncbi:MAG: alpha/beta hydrolase [Nocardioides sp.]
MSPADPAFWEPDVLGDPYVVEALVLSPDAEGAVEANLVRRWDETPRTKAVLHVHGFNDYFFHTEYAEWWAARGYTFYALDLRKHGRSIREHQTPCYVESLDEYYEELDAAWQRITERDGHREVVLSAHSTGGLTMSLWAHDRQPTAAGLVLNSPWVDMHGPFWLRIGTGVMRQLGSYQPKRELPRGGAGYYGQSISAAHAGEWPYDLAWKSVEPRPIYAGWLRAIRRGQARLHAGLDVRFPILVLTSGGTFKATEMSEEVYTHDIVLDVAQMRRWATAIGPQVTVTSVDGAMHDVVLSRPDVRTRVYAEMSRWARAYLP